MTLADITRENVLSAIAEFDLLSRDVFLEQYSPFVGGPSSEGISHHRPEWTALAGTRPTDGLKLSDPFRPVPGLTSGQGAPVMTNATDAPADRRDLGWLLTSFARRVPNIVGALAVTM